MTPWPCPATAASCLVPRVLLIQYGGPNHRVLAQSKSTLALMGLPKGEEAGLVKKVNETLAAATNINDAV